MTSKKTHIGIVLGSTRQGRFGEKPARWIHEIAGFRSDFTVELIDLRDHPLPYFDEPMPPAWAPVANEVARNWGDKLATLDGLIVVTPEYNHGVSAVLKNAFDYACKEFHRKPIGFVGYGSVGAARAVEQLRMVAVELQMAPVRNAVHIGLAESMGLMNGSRTFEDFPYLAQAATGMLDDIAWWAKALKIAREEAA
jgi:NAD(P)H-dependent FMN reductase